MGKLQFFEMREEQIATMYDATFTKKDAVATGIKLADGIINGGNVDKMHALANISRLKWVIDSADKELRDKVSFLDKDKILGLEFAYVNGGNTVNYSDDPIYNELKKDLDDRVELLKLAQKQEVADLSGNLVPRVSTTPRKSSITIK